MPDNDTKTHITRDPHPDIPQPENTSKGEYEWSLCHEVLKRREDYLNHAMAPHKVEEAVVGRGRRSALASIMDLFLYR